MNNLKILALDCSATPASVAILEDEKILAFSYTNVKLTHSQTLMPMVENLLKASLTDLNDIEGFAISAGPGSFTGVRIGISVIKGLSIAQNKPCVAVSTLIALAQNYIENDCYICAVMDARCNQVYNAIFEIDNGCITRLCDDRAIMCDQLLKEIESLSQKGKPIVIVGDGTDVFAPYCVNINNVKKSHPKNRFQNAAGVGITALEEFKKGNTLTNEQLLPIYLRLPQAERELKNKEKKL